MRLPVPEDDLIAAALAGSTEAWEQLVRKYERRVYNYGLRLTGNRADALDLMQEVFIGVYRSLKTFRGEAQFTSWLFSIAHNKAVDMNRRERPLSFQDLAGNDDFAPRSAGDPGGAGEKIAQERAAPWSHEAPWLDAGRAEPAAQLADARTRLHLQHLLASLSWEQRMVIELKIYQSLTFEEIALMQDIPVNTAKTRFYSALRKMKSTMEQDYGMPADAADGRGLL